MPFHTTGTREGFGPSLCEQKGLDAGRRQTTKGGSPHKISDEK